MDVYGDEYLQLHESLTNTDIDDARQLCYAMNKTTPIVLPHPLDAIESIHTLADDPRFYSLALCLLQSGKISARSLRRAVTFPLAHLRHTTGVIVDVLAADGYSRDGAIVQRALSDSHDAVFHNARLITSLKDRAVYLCFVATVGRRLPAHRLHGICSRLGFRDADIPQAHTDALASYNKLMACVESAAECPLATAVSSRDWDVARELVKVHPWYVVSVRMLALMCNASLFDMRSDVRTLIVDTLVGGQFGILDRFVSCVLSSFPAQVYALTRGSECENRNPFAVEGVVSTDTGYVGVVTLIMDAIRRTRVKTIAAIIAYAAEWNQIPCKPFTDHLQFEIQECVKLSDSG